MEKPDIGTWQAELLRLTSFFSAQDEGSDWWEKVVGETPENVISQPKMQLHQTEGPFNGGRLVLQKGLLRFDWLLMPNPFGTLEEGIPVLGQFMEINDGFVNLMMSWLKMDTPDIVRLAFGAVLSRPVPDRQSGYKELSAYLPFELDDRSSDFLYQINRPRPCATIRSLEINRLSRWSVSMWRLALRPLPAVSNVTEQYKTRLELDVSSSAAISEPIPREALIPLFLEIVDIGKEIASQGDIE
ncbi:MAG: hypothetical protein ABSG90_14395 [Dehalococcoidia bacterium]